MSEYAIAISWLVIASFAFVTDILAIFVIAHYYPYFHGTDVTLTSLLVAMAGNALLVLPIPAYLELSTDTWYPGLCTGYVWCCLTFRVAQILGLSVMAIHWSTMLKLAAEKKKYFSTKFLKISIVFVWLFSAFFGLLPVIGAVKKDYNTQSSCRFLGFNLGAGYGLFFIISVIAAMIVSLVCTIDASLLIRSMKEVSKTKFPSGRFHLPDRRAEVPGQAVNSANERHLRLTLARNLSEFVLLFICLSFCISHLPYAIIQAVQLFSQSDRELLEPLTLYLVGFESLLLPHSLWLFSRRYKHAITYQWQVYFLRRKDVEEEGVYHPYSCMLQSYAREKDKMVSQSRPASRGPYSQSGTIRSTASDIHSTHRSNGRVHVSSVADEMMRIDQQNQQMRAQVVARNLNGSVINGDIVMEVHPHRYQERSVDVEIDTRPRSRPKSAELRAATPVLITDNNRRTPEPSNGSNSNTSNQVAFISARQDVKRSSSGQSRKDLKENIKKKHLPPIFINEAFDAEDNKAQAAKKLTQNRTGEIHTIYKSDKNQESVGSLHFYMSSDYHPDYLIDSLPRPRMVQDSFDNESEDTGEIYGDDDIMEVLDDGSDGAVGERNAIRVSNESQYNKSKDARPYMSTFKSPPSFDRVSPVDRIDENRGAYSTYEDLSVQTLNELEESESYTDEFTDGYHSFKGMKRLSHKGDDKDTQLSKFLVFASERSAIKKSPNNSPEVSSLGRSGNGAPYNSLHGVEMAMTSFGRSDSLSKAKMWERSSFNGRSTNYYNRNTVDDVPGHLSDTGHVYKETPRHFTEEETYFSDEARAKGNYNPNANVLSTFSATEVHPFHPKSKELKQELTSFLSKRDIDNEAVNRLNNKDERSMVERVTIDDENASSDSNSSVTLSPYKGEVRKPWMIDFDNQDDAGQMEEPLVADSDNETLRDSHDSTELRTSLGFDFKQHPHSNLSTPVSCLFDEEIERGFEEALDVHQGSSVSVYGGVGLCFESIKEEPEDITSSGGSNPFLDNISNPDEFRTQAIISRSSRSDSRTSNSSSASLEDTNPFNCSSDKSQRKVKHRNLATTRVYVTDADAEFGDSGFGSAIDKYNTSSESSGQHELPSRENLSPWLDEDTNVRDADLSFESNFCVGETTNESAAKDGVNKPPILGQFSKKSGFDSTSVESIKGNSMFEGRRPVHKSLLDVKSRTRQPPVRVKSLDSESPVSHRKLPKRADSFEGMRNDFKPAYF